VTPASIWRRSDAQDAGTELGSSRNLSSIDSTYAADVPLRNSSWSCAFGVALGVGGAAARWRADVCSGDDDEGRKRLRIDDAPGAREDGGEDPPSRAPKRRVAAPENAIGALVTGAACGIARAATAIASPPADAKRAAM
jgi:hypothetical protein